MKDLEAFGTSGERGIHKVLENRMDISDALDRALNAGFEDIFFYTNITDWALFIPWMEQHLTTSKIEASSAGLTLYFD